MTVRLCTCARVRCACMHAGAYVDVSACAHIATSCAYASSDVSTGVRVRSYARRRSVGLRPPNARHAHSRDMGYGIWDGRIGIWDGRIGIWTCAVCGCPPVPEHAQVCAYRDMRCVRVCVGVRVQGYALCRSMRGCAGTGICAVTKYVRVCAYLRVKEFVCAVCGDA